MIARGEAGLVLQDAGRWLEDPEKALGARLSPEDEARLSEALEKACVHRWHERYFNPDVCDGEQWELQVNLRGGEAIVSSGSNEFPRYFRTLQKAILRAGGFHG